MSTHTYRYISYVPTRTSVRTNPRAAAVLELPLLSVRNIAMVALSAGALLIAAPLQPAVYVVAAGRAASEGRAIYEYKLQLLLDKVDLRYYTYCCINTKILFASCSGKFPRWSGGRGWGQAQGF